jgi:3-oxoacyl-[acyl-carrier-protein] synthase I
LLSGLLNNQPRPQVIKAHGTSTPLGDAIELFSIVNHMGEEGYKVTAPKSQFGHMLGAAGSVEFILSVLMLQEQKISPCLNSDTLNTELEPIQLKDNYIGPKKPLAAFRHLLPAQAMSMDINTIASMNYGFGGTNSAILISKY